MQQYKNFKTQAQISYHTAIVCGGKDTFDMALNSRTYLTAFLNGYIDALIMAQVCTTEEIMACRKYADIVVKAFTKYYIRTKY